MTGQRLRTRTVRRLVAGLMLVLLGGLAPVTTAAVPTGFQDTVVFANLVNPMVVQFAADGRVFVAEKSGLIKVFDNLSDTTPATFADLTTRVHNFWDRGMLGMALAPNFPTSPFVYVLYAHNAPIGGTAPAWPGSPASQDDFDGCPNPPGATGDGCVISARLSRLQAAGNVMTGPEQVLVEDWCQQYPSHSVGTLWFAPDGSLYASGGDGASFNFADWGQDGDPLNPCGDPPTGAGGTLAPPTAEGGALRSQDLRTMPPPTGGTTYAALVGGLSPVAHWRLGEATGTTATSTTGTNAGTYSGGPALGTAGLLTGDSNTAVGFDGVDDVVTVPSSASLNQTSRLSVAAWIRPTDWGGNRRILQKGTSDNQYRLTAQSGQLMFEVTNVGSVSAALPSTAARHLVVGVFDGPGASLRLYVDGVQVASATPTVTTAPTSTSNLAIGDKPGSVVSNDHFRGVIDDVSIHSVALSSAQVAQLWTAGTTGSGGGGSSTDPLGLSGTIIRVDPATGAGLSGNPMISSTDPNARRVVANGLRNPFRFTMRPGTNEVWLGDVGWDDTEEIDRIVAPTDATVDNFGWPCYEGPGHEGSYDNADLTICEGLYSAGAGAVVSPYYSYLHSDKIVPGETCATGSSSISGMAFYSGGTYPATFTDGLFFADYSRKCIWFMRAGANGLPDKNQISTFVNGGVGPVDLRIGPGGDLFYADYDGGAIHRVTFNSSNTPPTAVIAANPTSGPAPLTVTFSGAGSSDPDPGDTLTYAWDLDGDGQFDDSSAVAPPPQTYTAVGTVTVRLRVTDPDGASGTASQPIAVGNTPPVPVIDTPLVGTTFRVNDQIAFTGHATDGQDGTVPANKLTWALVQHHCPSNCHTHDLQTFGGASGSFPAPDHEYPSFLELILTAEDSGGLKTSVSRQLDPKTVNLTFQSAPAGLQLTVGSFTGTAPFFRTVIDGSANTVSAPTPQTQGGSTYAFASWSDGGAQSHTITAPSSAATYTATYQLSTGTTYAAIVGGLSPVGHWRLGEATGTAAADATGANPGTYLGAPALGAAGLLTGDTNTAVTFDGTNDSVTIPSSASLNQTSRFSIAAWIRPTDWGGNRRIIQKGTSDNQYRLTAQSGQLMFHVTNVGSVTAALPSANARHLVVAVFDGPGASLRLYVDGALVGSVVPTVTVAPTTTQILSIGDKPGSVVSNDHFRGVIDDVSIHSVALSTAQVGQLWSVGSSGP